MKTLKLLYVTRPDRPGPLRLYFTNRFTMLAAENSLVAAGFEVERLDEGISLNQTAESAVATAQAFLGFPD